MWNRIFNLWKENMGKYDETRNINGLSCRWGVIQAAVSKFQGVYEKLERAPQSGTNLEYVKTEAMRTYSKETGSSFKFEHCWEIMKENPKWCTHQLTKVGGSKKQKVVAETFVTPSSTPTPEPCTANGDDNVNSSDITAENLDNSGIARPLGRKGSKDKSKKNDEAKGVIGALTNLQSSLDRQFVFAKEELELKKAKDEKEYALRKEALEIEKAVQKRKERKEQERILNRDLSKLQPAFRLAVERMQAQILKEWENDGLFGENSRNEDADN